MDGRVKVRVCVGGCVLEVRGRGWNGMCAEGKSGTGGGGLEGKGGKRGQSETAGDPRWHKEERADKGEVRPER